MRRLTEEMGRPRDRINRRTRFHLTIVAVGFAVLVVPAFTEKYLPPAIFRSISYGAIGLFLAGMALMHVGITFPKCHAMLGLALMYSREKVTHCPRCGIDFDQEY